MPRVFLRVDGVVLMDTETVTTETPEQIVTRLYGEIFNRAPDPEGLAYWAGRLRSDLTEAGLREVLSGYAGKPVEPPPQTMSGDKVGFDLMGPGNYKINWLQAGVQYPFTAHFECSRVDFFPAGPHSTFRFKMSGPVNFDGSMNEIFAEDFPRQPAGAVFTVSVVDSGLYHFELH